MLAATPETYTAEHLQPTTTLGEVLAHCPLCFTPGFATDPECHSCGAQFDLGVMECGRCSYRVSAAARVCPECGFNLD